MKKGISTLKKKAPTWILVAAILASGAGAAVGGEQDQIKIKIAHPDDADPGFFEVTGVLEQYEPQTTY